MILALMTTLFSGVLMVSRFSYYSFKDIDLRKRVPFVSVTVVLSLFVLIALWPSIVLYSLFLLYTLSGPLHYGWRRWRKFRQRRVHPG